MGTETKQGAPVAAFRGASGVGVAQDVQQPPAGENRAVSRYSLKACPFCGAEPALLETPGRGGHNESPPSWQVACRCGAAGPSIDQIRHRWVQNPQMGAFAACAFWNRRAGP